MYQARNGGGGGGGRRGRDFSCFLTSLLFFSFSVVLLIVGVVGVAVDAVRMLVVKMLGSTRGGLLSRPQSCCVWPRLGYSS